MAMEQFGLPKLSVMNLAAIATSMGSPVETKMSKKTLQILVEGLIIEGQSVTKEVKEFKEVKDIEEESDAKDKQEEIWTVQSILGGEGPGDSSGSGSDGSDNEGDNSDKEGNDSVDGSEKGVVHRDDGAMQIFVKPANAKTITLNVEAIDTIYLVKAMIEAKNGTPRREQSLVFDGSLVEDDSTLAQLKVVDGSRLTMKVSGLGGGKRGRASENPFMNNVECITLAGENKLFEKAFIEAVQVSCSSTVNSLESLKKLSHDELLELQTYLNSDKTKHSEKIQHLATTMHEFKVMDEAVKKLTAAMD